MKLQLPLITILTLFLIQNTLTRHSPSFQLRINTECKVRHCIECPTSICQKCDEGYSVDKKKNICIIKADISYKPGRNIPMILGIALLAVCTTTYFFFRLRMTKIIGYPYTLTSMGQ